jgi:2-(1,2-epoxy-1,2-dihydrophenyl)acetyl-CoA isomerase
MSEEILLTELSEGVLTITLNRPKANAFNDELVAATKEAFKQARKDDAVRVVLFTGSGKLFSAGQDVSNLDADQPRSFRAHLQKNYNPLVLQMRQLEKPVIAAVNGAVAGAALGLALACDLRIASDTAKFVVGFGGIGLAPDSAVSLMLPLTIGLGRAAEAAFFNQPITAEQALAWGLVNKVVPGESLMEEARAWARQLAGGPTYAMGLTKRDFNKAIIPHLEDMLDYEAHNQEIAGNGPDHKEGLKAFLEKREPDYRKKE